MPTDADYAMELISQRVARGLDVQPKRRTVRKSRFGHQSSSAVNETEQHERDDIHPTVDWKKWGERAESTKARAAHVKHIFQDGGVSTLVPILRYMADLVDSGRSRQLGCH